MSGARRLGSRRPAHQRDSENDHERREQVVVNSGDRRYGGRDVAEHAHEPRNSAIGVLPMASKTVPGIADYSVFSNQ